MSDNPNRIRTLGIVTSGGDSPGFNPCVRAAARMAFHLGWQVYGIERGFEGLVTGEFHVLTSRSLHGIISQGGTILGSARYDAFREPLQQRRALRSLNEHSIDALVIIGGGGTMRGALDLHRANVPVIGVPGTIENDVYGTELALGVDTALNTALEAMDRIRDTASAQRQVFLIELMGESSGYLTLMAGIAGGAEMVCIPEVPFEMEDVVRETADAYIRGKKHCIITVAEGARPGAEEIYHYLRENEARTGFGVRLSILGHIMRGGSPSAHDRYLGTLFGAEAVRLLAAGESGSMVGLRDNQFVTTPLAEVCARKAELDPGYLELARMLAK